MFQRFRTLIYGKRPSVGPNPSNSILTEGKLGPLVMGLTLSRASSIPAADSEHMRMSAKCGRRIVEMVCGQLTPDRIVTPASVQNAELVCRWAEWIQPQSRYERGWDWMFLQHVMQANQGCDFDFPHRDFDRAVGEPDISKGLTYDA